MGAFIWGVLLAIERNLTQFFQNPHKTRLKKYGVLILAICLWSFFISLLFTPLAMGVKLGVGASACLGILAIGHFFRKIP